MIHRAVANDLILVHNPALDPEAPGDTAAAAGLPAGGLEAALTDGGPVLRRTAAQGLQLTAVGALLCTGRAPTGSRDRAIVNCWPKNLCHQLSSRQLQIVVL